ncbi:MAG: YqhV family protein [Bacillota bacterium]
MWFVTDKYVISMAAMRVLSSLIEMSAAILMLKVNRVDQALKVNALLALVGPLVMMTVFAIGLAGLAGKIPLHKMIIIGFGVFLIFYGIRS